MSRFPFRYGDSRKPDAAAASRKTWLGAYETEDEAAVRAQLSRPDDADCALITDFLAGELSPQDRERVEERLRTDARFRELAEPLMMIWEIPGPLDREETRADRAEAERSLEKLKKRMELEEQGIHTLTRAEKRVRRRNRRLTLAGVMATLIPLFYEAWQHRPPRWDPVPQVFVNADTAGTRDLSLTLPDSTKLTLAPGSHVNYTRWFSKDERTLFVDGEATFSVPRGSGETLVVKGANFEVRASAGSFTVHAFSHDPFAYVQVNEGTAEVRGRTVYYEGPIMTLRTGEGVRIGPGILVSPVMPITLRH